MSPKDYFKEYWKCIDTKELNYIMDKLKILYKTSSLCPHFKDVFKAFELCPYNKLTVVMLSQDPYPQKDVATGLAFANKKDTTELSPSLEIIKEAVINFEIPHNYITFVPDLESWANQGVLLLNSALTVEEGKIGSHINMWRPFISKFLYNLSCFNNGLIYILFGKQAQSFKYYIGDRGHIIEVEHPAYYARIKQNMPYKVFTDINKLLKLYWDTEITWYQEIKFNDDNGKEIYSYED